MDSLSYSWNLAGSLSATATRGGAGVVARPAAQQPAKTLELYDFEGCPHCRLVREVITELDLDVMVYPCPKQGQRFRPKVLEAGGKHQFPFLIDPNNGVELYEAADIIDYLFRTYGETEPPLHWRAVELQRVGSMLSSIPLLGRGSRVRPSQAPEEPLELYSFEASPFARPVRELLCELEIPYLLRSVGRTVASDWIPPAVRQALSLKPKPESRNRKRLLADAGQISIPYLVDPNTGTGLAESSAILTYLESHYATG
ncbi:MAG: glutathione S-transferase N-terminal domain-containing protein [Pseudomonadota bacterium]